jgi:hypothetical protein
MNKIEARRLLQEQVRDLRLLPYDALCQLRSQRRKARGADGVDYTVHIQSFPDGSGDNVRVMVAVDDGGWAAWKPLVDDFIISPDGSFVGEETEAG